MSRIDNAKQLLRNEETLATSCFCAVDLLLPNSWRIWEPETVWLELDHLNVDIPESNRAQVMAIRTLLNTDRFWYDAPIFAKICNTLNNEDINYDAMEDVPVAYIAWAIKEVKALLQGFDPAVIPEFDREPVGYTAIQLFREGFVVAPDLLSWAQPSLDNYYPKETEDLRQKVQTNWAAASKHDVKDAAYPETPIGVQFAKLASVQVYVNDREVRLKQELAQLY